MEGKLRYHYKNEEIPNSIEGWSIIPITDKITSVCYQLNENSLNMIKDYDKTKVFVVDYELKTNCRINDDGYHVHHGVIAELKICNI